MKRKATFLMAATALSVSATALSGCGVVTSTTDAIADSTHQATNTTSSTSHSFDAADYNHRAQRFVKTDIDAIREQAARGYGDELDTLATLLHEPNQAEFSRWMQRHYATLFSRLNRPTDLLQRIRRLRAQSTVAWRNGGTRPAS